MRGDDPQHAAIFSYLSPEERVPQAHPLRHIRVMVDAVLKELSPPFARLYSSTGPGLDCPGAVAAGALAASALPRAQGAAAEGTTGRSPPVALVWRLAYG